MEKLGFNQYQKLAARTQNKSLTPTERFLHAACGLADEVEELATAKHFGNPDEIKYEAGDVLWMVAEMCDVCGLKMHELFTSANMTAAEEERASLYVDESNPPKPRKLHFDTWLMASSAASICGVGQKLLQGHAIDTSKVVRSLRLLMACLKHVASYHGFSLRNIMWENIEKLKERYPEGFSAEKSINRAK